LRSRAAITIARPREHVEHLWNDPEHRPEVIAGLDAQVTFVDAPGDRGTEIHVKLRRGAPAGVLGEAVQKALGTEPLARVKDDLRRFKQQVETGVIARSEAVPEGEALRRKLRWRPAQPLKVESQKVGV
jgi:uncharacterized membrane protein